MAIDNSYVLLQFNAILTKITFPYSWEDLQLGKATVNL